MVLLSMIPYQDNINESYIYRMMLTFYNTSSTKLNIKYIQELWTVNLSMIPYFLSGRLLPNVH